MFTLPDVTDIVALALAEDLGVDSARFRPGAQPDPSLLLRDVTTHSVVPLDATLAGRFVAREPLVVCGLPVAEAVYEALCTAIGMPEQIDMLPLVAEGTLVEAGRPVAEIEGPADLVLAGERCALDFLMVLSGIASEARRWQEAAGERLAIIDTRKTFPGLRALSKYAVVVGGATNHRQGLWDMVLVKDNHLRRVGLTEAVEAARAGAPGLAVEIEADTVEQALEAVRAGADLVLLDNMDDEMLAEAVAAIRTEATSLGTRVLTEASGGITLDRVFALRRTGVDRASTSAITFARPRDLALDADWTA